MNDKETILKNWNRYAKRIKGISSHKSLKSKVFIKYTKGFSDTESLDSILEKALLAHSRDDILIAIYNYFEIISHPEQYFFTFKYKSLGQFLYSGLCGTGGFLKFLDSNTPFERFKRQEESIFQEVKKEFQPVTIRFNTIGFDETSNTYYGLTLDELNLSETSIKQVEEYVDKALVGKKAGYFHELEKTIIYLLWTKRTQPQPELLRKFFAAWKVERTLIDLRNWFD